MYLFLYFNFNLFLLVGTWWVRDIASEWYFGRELVMGILMEQSKNGIDKKEKRERERS